MLYMDGPQLKEIYPNLRSFCKVMIVFMDRRELETELLFVIQYCNFKRLGAIDYEQHIIHFSMNGMII